MRFPIPSLNVFAAALVNHLWQSTAVVFAAWLLTLGLRKNRAAVRYWVWMATSLKFLLPFSLLISIGELFHSLPTHPARGPAITAAIDEVMQPFTQTATSSIPAPVASVSVAGRLPEMLLIVWVAGALIVLLGWLRQWTQLRRAVRAATSQALTGGVRVLSSSSLLEPGVFGILRPALVLPAGIVDRLSQPQIDAIVAHELCHIHRRDNLTYAMHMLVEAIFWFHPLVWWMGARLVEERERACDESVLQSGSVAEDYAEGILNVCKLYVESPLPCAAGVSGADLKKRIVRIMTGSRALQLNLGRMALLAVVGALAVAAPFSLGVLRSTQVLARGQDAPADIPKFDVVSIKPNKSGEMRIMMRILPDGFNMEGVPTQLMLAQAFNVENDRIVGAPAWVQTDHYDIQAKVAPEDAPKLDKLGREQRFAMLQPLLEERFNLKFHHETREMPVYLLVVAKGGSKLKPADPAFGADGSHRMPGMMMSPGGLEAHGAQLDMLAHVLSGQVGRTIIDKTGLTGSYDFSLHFTPQNMPPGMGPGPGAGPGGGSPGADAPPPPDTSGPDLLTALQEQLGLKLESEKGPVDVIVIDHIDKPSEN